MKKVVVAFLVVGLVSVAAVSYAHWGGGQGWGSNMWGYGPGSMMWGYGPGYMMRGYSDDTDVQKALDETVDLRKELNSKMFDYGEALRTGDQKKAEELYKEVAGLRDKVYEKVGYLGGKGYGRFGGGYGPGYGCGPYSR